MACGEGGPISQFDEEPVFAPSCRRCLALMDQAFPPTVVDDRLRLVAQVVVDMVVERGYAEVAHVPGDQVAALRMEVRRLMRQGTGHPTRTFYFHDVIYVLCDPIHQLHSAEYQRAGVEAIDAALRGEPIAPAPRKWQVSWDTWHVT